MREEDFEVIKVEIPKALAEKYGLRRGSITRAIIDLIEEKLGEVE